MGFLMAYRAKGCLGLGGYGRVSVVLIGPDVPLERLYPWAE